MNYKDGLLSLPKSPINFSIQMIQRHSSNLSSRPTTTSLTIHSRPLYSHPTSTENVNASTQTAKTLLVVQIPIVPSSVAHQAVSCISSLLCGLSCSIIRELFCKKSLSLEVLRSCRFRI